MLFNYTEMQILPGHYVSGQREGQREGERVLVIKVFNPKRQPVLVKLNVLNFPYMKSK